MPVFVKYIYLVHYHLHFWCFIHFSIALLLKAFYVSSILCSVGAIAVNKIVQSLSLGNSQWETGAIYMAGQEP